MRWREALVNPFMDCCEVHQATESDFQDKNSTSGFDLDVDAFMTAIEDPRPLFLQDCENAIRELLRSSGEAA